MTRLVTLTTDFGSGSGYVAEMKGCLLHAKTPIRLIDISHTIPSHDVRSTAWLIGQACHAFPADTLHIIVVDPGVGTERKMLWARIGDQEFICPDNGILSWALTKQPIVDARVLSPPENISFTFHGRDAFAPLAVKIIDGARPTSLGPPAGNLQSLEWPKPTESHNNCFGEIINVDTFGNLITNLPSEWLPKLIEKGGIYVDSYKVSNVVQTYGQAPPNTPVTLVGSQGFIEVAVVQGRADKRLSAGLGTPVSLRE